MGTKNNPGKNNPGKYDCYSKAKPDEPMFTLLGRDPMAPVLVFLWAVLRDEHPEPEKIVEALECARAMWKHAAALGKREQLVEHLKDVLDLAGGADIIDEHLKLFEGDSWDPAHALQKLREGL